MIYHSFRTSSEASVIGVRDGMPPAVIHPAGFSNKKTYQEMETFLGYKSHWERTRQGVSHDPPHLYTIEYAKLRPRAKLTDFLGFSAPFMACPFMLSAKAKAVFAKYCIPRSFLFDSLLYNKEGLVTSEYSLLYCPYLEYEVIDFAKSRFRMKTPDNSNWEYHTFGDLQAYESFTATGYAANLLQVASLVMSEKFDNRLDFFKCRIGPMYMSERLKAAIEEAGLSGLEFPQQTGSLAFAE